MDQAAPRLTPHPSKAPRARRTGPSACARAKKKRQGRGRTHPGRASSSPTARHRRGRHDRRRTARRRTRGAARARGPGCPYTHPGTVPPNSRAHKAAPRVPAPAPPPSGQQPTAPAAIRGRPRNALTQPRASHCQRRPEPVKETRLDRTRPATRAARRTPAAPGGRRSQARAARPEPRPGRPLSGRRPGDQGTPAGTGHGGRAASSPQATRSVLDASRTAPGQSNAGIRGHHPASPA